MDPKIEKLIRKFLTHSFEPINYTYYQLTDEERALCTRVEFEDLVAWLREK